MMKKNKNNIEETSVKSGRKKYDIPEEVEKFKLSSNLNKRNPIKKLIQNIEEKTNNGYLYKSFCLLIVVFFLSVLGYFFIYYQSFLEILFPLSLLLFLSIYNNWNIDNGDRHSRSFFYNVIRTPSNIIYLFTVVTLVSLFFINADSNINTLTFIKNASPLALASEKNLFISYSIIIGALLLIIPGINDVYLYYVRFRNGTDFGNGKIYARSFAYIFIALSFMFMIYFFYNYELFKPRKEFFQTVFIVSLASMIAYLVIFFNVIVFLFIYLLAKIFDSFYK